MSKLLSLIILLGLSNIATAQVPNSLPNILNEPPTLTLEHWVLGRSCYSLPSTSFSLDCNPAFLANSSSKKLRFNLNLNGSPGDTMKYSSDLSEGDEFALINKILDEKKPISLRGQADIWYQYDWWALSVTPFRFQGLSMSTNPAYPYVSMQLNKEFEVAAKTGFLFESDKNLSVGFQARYVSRDIFQNEFSAFDAMSETILIKTGKQHNFYLEPGVSYLWESEWKPRLSATIANLRIYRSGVKSKDLPSLDVGYSSSPDFLNNKLTTTLHFSTLFDILEDFGNAFRFSGLYNFGNDLSGYFTLAQDNMSIGLSGRIDTIILGAAFQSSDIDADVDNTKRVNSVLGEIGLEF